MLLPPIEAGRHLIDYLFDLGPVKAESPIEPADLPGWEYVLGVEFEPWEMRALVRLSREYHMALHSMKEWGALPPYRGVANQWRRIQRRQSDENVARMKQDAALAAEEEKQKTKGRKRDGNRQ